ncbi:AHH domain-containing protein [Qipengyuania xiapuensis]|uniref:AHH domain-containing protein n=1 Tax=Qipengyuania xiapuensis TaxID=2867236 RepID=A0ABX8ZXR6_9SPHN|nr:AHH domain-containing protein [Qipengyuania xiapuensis]
MAFRAVNRRNAPGYQPHLQRHHLLPCQLLHRRCFGAFFDEVGKARIGFDDFRRNGMLLPAREDAAMRMALPLHRGPHREYNAMVIERVGHIESCWARSRVRDSESAGADALMRLGLLQTALRRRLLDEARPFLLSRKDPAAREVDFSDLDALAEELWRAT